MTRDLLKEKMDYLFKTIYGTTLDKMTIEEHEGIIIGIDCINSFYDDTYTYFILPDYYDSWEYHLYRVLGSGKYGFNIEELECFVLDEVLIGIIDENGKCQWKRYKKDYSMLKLMVYKLKQKYGFDGLYHFTDFSNLQNIINSGYLKSRNECEYDSIYFRDSAARSVMSHTSITIKECVRFYYRPKTPTLYNNEGIKLKEWMDKVPHLPIPVCLVFDEKLIYLDTTEFTDKNAGCSDVDIGSDFRFFNNIDWTKVFSNQYYYLEEWRNKMQAELLSKIPVSLEYLNKIIFRCEADMKRAINLFGEDERYTVDLNVFSDKNNYHSNPRYYNNFIKNYNIKYLRKTLKLDMLLLDIQFQKPWDEYETDILIKNENGKIIKIITFDNSTSKKIDDKYSIQLLLDDFDRRYHKLEVYLNDILCIEEYLEKFR